MRRSFLDVLTPLFPTLCFGVFIYMYAEQQHLSIFNEIFARFKRPTIKGLDAYPLFTSYFQDQANGLSKEEAHRRFRIMLEANLRSYTQEGIGDRDIQEYGTEVTRARLVPKLQESSDRIVFRDYKDTDSLNDQRLKNREVYRDHPDVISYFDLELEVWDRLWHSVVLPIEELIGQSNQQTILSRLNKAGFRHLYDFESNPELCAVSFGIKALFPELENDDSIEIYEHPSKYILTSPRHPLHHKGETTVVRLVRFVYIPKINKFAFLERGLFTAYTNDEVASFYTLDGQPKPKFNRVEEMLAHIATISQEFNALPPHAVFNHIINILGDFPEVPVGKNVVREKVRTFSTQIEYIERVLAFEEQMLTMHPSLASTLEKRLQWIMEPVEHSLLRANTLDVELQVANYTRIFSDLSIAQNPQSAKRQFRLGVLSSYPEFAIRVGSILDCSTGTLLGGVRQLNGFGGLESMVGTSAFSALKSLEGKSILNRAEFESYARSLGKDPDKFTTVGKCKCKSCASKGLDNYLGPCGWCLGCEVKDDLGLSGPLNFDEMESVEKNDNSDVLPENRHTISTAFSRIFCGKTIDQELVEPSF